MAQVPLWVDLIAQALLQHLGFGEAAIGLTLPDLRTVAGDPKHATGARFKTDAGEIVAEGRK